MFSPVNAGKNPFWRALVRVEIAGEKRAAWAKAIKSAGVFVCLCKAGMAYCVVVGVLSIMGSSTAVLHGWWKDVVGSVHRPCVLHGHWMSEPSGHCMMQWLLLNLTMQLWSQRGATASREL